MINANDVNNLIHIKPSVNPDTDEHVDRYWLDASLNNPKMLEDIWNELQEKFIDVMTDTMQGYLIKKISDHVFT